MIAAANAKKKTNTKGKKGKEEPQKDAEEESKTVAKIAKKEQKELDLTNPKEFMVALQERAARPFTFGPIEFDGLNISDDILPFDDN